MLFRMSAEDETRRLILIGLIVAICLAAFTVSVTVNPFNSRKSDYITVVMDLPYVGQGIDNGSPVMMHGVKVGEVTAVSRPSNDDVRLNVSLDSTLAADLTDDLLVDFRPANYFGVTGVNLFAGQGGRPLANGSHIRTEPTGNYTLQTLLYRLGEITGGVVTPQLVDVINRATRYTDGLNPLIEAMVTSAETLTRVQTVSTEQLLRNATGISVAFPGLVNAATAAGYEVNQRSGYVNFIVSGEDALPGEGEVPIPGNPVTEEFWNERATPFLDMVANSFFGSMGRLLSTNIGNLLPVVKMIQSVTDTVPALITPVGVNDMLVELRTRLEKMYAGSEEQRALQVHIILDRIPGVQAPINALGGP